MVVSLVHRELRGRYKGSVLGFFWTLLNPLLQLLVYTVVFSVIMRAGYEKYYLFLFVALVPWMFFSGCVNAGSTIILSSKELVNKIYFPREVLPISHVIAQLVNMLLSFAVVLIVLAVTGYGFNYTALLFMPIIIMIEFFMTLGMTFVSCSITVFFRDLQFILSVLMMAWQFLSPIMYGIDMVPEQFKIYFSINPVTPMLNVYRDILYYKQQPSIYELGKSFFYSMVIFMLGLLLFECLKKKFSEEM